MKIKYLNEAINLIVNEEIKFADFDVEKLYNTIFPKDRGSISFDEMKTIYDFLNIDKNTDEKEIRAIRNTIVKYWDDKKVDYREKLKRTQDKELLKKVEIFDDQMSAFTGALDHLLMEKE